MASLFLVLHEEESEGQLEPRERGFDCRLESFDSRLADLIHPNVLSTTHLLGKTMKPLTVVLVRLTTMKIFGSPRRRPFAPCRLGIRCRRRTLSPMGSTMNRAEHWREGVSILDTCGCDLAFDRQSERIDGDMSLAPLDFLACVEAARPARFRRLDALIPSLSSDGCRRRPPSARLGGLRPRARPSRVR